MGPFFDTHEKGCNCSYCASGYSAVAPKGRMRYGLNIPPGWLEKHSWFVIKYWPNRYIRWCRS